MVSAKPLRVITRSVPRRASKANTSSLEKRCRTNKTWFFIWRESAIIARTLRAWLLARAMRSYKRPEDGIVLIDQERCRGYRKCVEACPYKKSLYRGTTRTSEKCIACYPRVEGRDQQGGGQPMQTRCMAACIGQIRLQGLVELNKDGTWKETGIVPFTILSMSPKSLCRFTRSSARNRMVITSRRGGLHALISGRCLAPGVDAAIERYSAPDRELQAVLQLFGKDHRICFRYELNKVRRSLKPRSTGRSLSFITTPSLATQRTARRSSRPPSRTASHPPRQTSNSF